MIIINGDIEIPVYVLDTKESLINRISDKLDIIPDYIYAIGGENSDDINLPPISEILDKNKNTTVKSLGTILKNTNDIKEYIKQCSDVLGDKFENTSIESKNNITPNDLVYFWMLKKDISIENINFVITSLIGSDVYDNITIENKYSIYKNRYDVKLKDIVENVIYFSKKMDNITGTIPEFINFNTISETISFEFENIYKNTIESLFDNLILINSVPFSQLISKKFDNLSCFKTLKNTRVYENFYSTFYSDEDIELFEEKRDNQGLQTIFKNNDSGMIEIQLKIYTDEKEERNMFEKASLYLSENEDKVICEITLDYEKFKKIQFDDNEKIQKENEIKNLIKNIFIQQDNEKSLEIIEGKKIQEIKQEFIIPKFTMNFTLSSDVIMNTDIFRNVFAIDESSRTSLKNENRTNILFVSEFLQKYNMIKDIENDINNLEVEKKNERDNRNFSNVKSIEKNISYLKSVKDSYIKRKFKFSIIREMRENFASIAPVTVQQIQVGEYFTKIEIVKSSDEMDIQYFKKVLEKLCIIYKNEEKTLGEEYKKLLKGISDFDYKYKSKIKTKVQALAMNPFATPGSSRKCSHQPRTIDKSQVVRIIYPDNKAKCIYGFKKNNDYPDDTVEYSKELMNNNFDFVMKIDAPSNWQGDNELYYTCPLPPDKERIYPGLYKLKEPQPNFSYIPCCYKKITNNSANCKKYFDDTDDTVIKETKGQQYTLKTNKILREGQTAIIPNNIQQFLLTYLGDFEYKLIREGVPRNTASFLECMNKLTDDNIDREKLSEYEFIYELTRQECYDLNKEEIVDIVKNKYIDPKYFIHFLSSVFNFNIVLFEMGKENNELTGDILEPRHIYGHYEFDKTREKTVCIIEHLGSESDDARYPQCEVIGFYKDDINDTKYDFPVKVYDKYVEKCKTYISNQKINKINLPEQLLSKIEKQGFDGFGKSRILFCKHNDKIIQVFTTPLPSIDVGNDNFSSNIETSDIAIEFFDNIGIKRDDFIENR